MMAVAILVCEFAFWAFLLAGLTARYVWRRPRLSVVLLLGSPVIDLGMLVLTAVDLSVGGDATQVHALAAIYLGFSVAFGHSAVAWADRWFAHRFAGGPRPVKSTRTEPERVAHEWREFRKAALAWAISCAMLLGLTALVGEVEPALPLLNYAALVTVVLAIWFLTGPVAAVASARSAAPPAGNVPMGSSPVRADTTRADTAPADSVRGDTVTEQRAPESSRPAPWAPWWAYLIVIVGANYLRQVVLPVGTVPEWAVVVIAVTVSATLFAVVTAVYRTAIRA